MKQAVLSLAPALFATWALSGCAQPGTTSSLASLAPGRPAAAAQRNGWVRSGKLPATILYVANVENATVTLYDAESTSSSPRAVGILSEGVTDPVALATDGKGDVFVANGASGSSPANVQEYEPGSVSPSATYSSGIADPVALAVDDGSTLYVANGSGPPPAPLVVGPTIVEFPAGSTTPSATVSDPNASSLSAIAVDHARNLYLANSSYLCCPVPTIDELIPNGAAPLVLAIAQVNGAPFRGIALDALGNLLGSNGSDVDIYAASTETWPAVIPPASTFGARGQPSALAFDPGRTKLFVIDASGNDVIGYAYPSGEVLNLVSKSIENPVAVAVGPAGNAPQRSPQPPKPAKLPVPGSGTVYLTTGGGGVQGYDARTGAPGRQLSQSGSQSVGLAVDAKKDLYVANLAQTENVTVYGPRGQQPLREFAAPFDDPYITEAVAPDGTVAIAEAQPSQVIIFYQGSQSPTEISMPFFPAGVAFDGQSNMYVSIGSYVEELPNTGTGFGSPTQLFTGSSFRQVALDGAGNLIVENYNEYPENYTYAVYPPGQATPTYEIGANLADSYFALDARDEFLYAINFHSGTWVFRYPTGTPYAFFPTGYANTDNIAIDPAAQPGPPWIGGAVRRNIASSRRFSTK